MIKRFLPLNSQASLLRLYLLPHANFLPMSLVENPELAAANNAAAADAQARNGSNPLVGQQGSDSSFNEGAPVKQTGNYNVLDNASDEDDTAESDADKCFLVRFANYVVPYGGVLSGMFNLASVTLGAGIISIPSAFHTTGILMSIFYLAVVTSLTIYSIRLLVIASERTGLRTFEELSRGLFGRGGDIVTAFLMILLCFGGAVGYIIAVGDIFSTLLTLDSTPAYLKTKSGRRLMVSVIWLCFMFPLCLPKQVNSLRYVSAVGVSFIIFFVFCIVGYSCSSLHKNGIPKDIVLASSGNAGVSGLGLFIFAYLCQVNTFKIYYEMRPARSVNRMTWEAGLSCGICGFLYFLCGFFGYMAFGNDIKESILAEYKPYEDVVFFVCYVGLLVKLCAAFSLNMLACRTALFAVLHMDVPSMPYWKHTIISSIFAVCALIIGLFFDYIRVVFSLVGGLCGGFIGFIFPALFVMYAGNWSRERVGWVSYLATYFLMFCGVVAVVFGTGDSILSTVMKYS